MVRLRVLGAVDLLEDGGRDDAEAVLAQPKRLALLTYLALARPSGFHRREVLLSLLWPQSDRATARNSLRQALHFLRHSLGDAVIVSRGENDVGVDHQLFWCDAAAFEVSLESGDRDEAIALYRGDLMPGMLIADAPEFNRWLDSERDHLRQRVEAALEEVAREAQSRGHHDSALRARRRGAALEPLSARVALALMQALVDAGDRAGAIQHAAAFARNLHDELGVDTDDSVTSFAAELRSGFRAGLPEMIPDKPPHDPTRSSAAKHGEATLLVVLPFAVHGEAAHHYLEQGMVDLLSRSLDGADTLRVVDPYAVIGLTSRSGAGASDPELGRQIGRTFGAELFVLGSVVSAHGRLQVFATLYHVDKGRLVTAEANVADEGALFEIVEDLTRQLLMGRLTPAQQLTRIAAMLTPSITALKAYLTGESHYRRGRFGPAREALERAVAEDPSFAVAWYRLGHVVFWQHQGQLAVQHIRRALGLSERLRGQERALIDAFLSSLEGRHREAERCYREVLSVYPENVEAWLGLAQVILHFNPFRGRPSSEAQKPLSRVLELDPENGPARMFTAYAFAKEGKYAEHVSTVRHWDDKSEFSIYPRTMHALLYGTQEDGDAIIKELAQASDATVNEACRYVARLTQNLPGAERIARLLVDQGRSRATNAYGFILAAQLAAAAGRHGQAFGALSEAAGIDPDAARLHRGFLATLPFLPVSRAEIDELRRLMETVSTTATATLPDVPGKEMHEGLEEALRLYVLGHLHARAEAFDTASMTAETLAALDVTPANSASVNDWSRGIRAHVAWRRGQDSDALALLEGSHLEVSWAQRLAPSPFLSQNFERYLRAQLLDMVGRHEDALGWYECVTGDFTHEVIFLAPSYLRRAQIHDRRGDYARAREFYQRFISLWRGSEPEEALVVQDAHQRLIRLGGPSASSDPPRPPHRS